MVNMTNKSIPATKAKTAFAELLDFARMEPVTVTRNNRAVAVVLSPEEYARLVAHDDKYWGEEAKKAAKKGLLGERKSSAFLSAVLNAND